MSSTPFSRKREIYVPAEKNIVRMGTLREKSRLNKTVFQTIPITYTNDPLQVKIVTWDSLHKGPPFTEGGDFAQVRIGVNANGVQGAGIREEPGYHSGPVTQKYWEYSGGFVRPVFSWETGLSLSYSAIGTANPFDSGFLSSLEDMGAEAYDRLRPRLEVAGASVFLAEARDVPRMLKTTADLFRLRWKAFGGNDDTPFMAGPKEASEHFLNHNFAWVPFISDLIKFDKVYQNSKAYLEKIKLENGTWVRKARALGQSRESVQIHSGLNAGIPWRPELNSMCNWSSEGGIDWTYRYTQRVRTFTESWATGSFRYYRPEFDDTLANFESAWNRTYRLLTIYGARVNPSVLWRICPWSWLIDWFTNIGAIIDRAISWASDAVVSRWMFCMQRTSNKIEHIVTVNWKNGTSNMVWTNEVSTKLRQQATSSYGFSLKDPLTGRQLAILAALGLSRGKHPVGGAP